VEAQTVDGRTLSVRCDHPRGSPENPLTRAQIEDKFRTYARGVLPATAAEEAIGAITRLEELTSVRRLMDLLRGGDEKRARRSA
jgi:2-methylcitrate dehydratase PrpD